MTDLILEFYSEEIPAGMQAPAAADLQKKVADFLKSNGIEDLALETFCAPQRLALLGRNLPVELAEQREEKKGPRVDAPEIAIEGFLKANGLTSTDGLSVREDSKGSFYILEEVIPGRNFSAALEDFVPELVRGFNWPKSMRWGDGTLRWVRPLRALLCMFDGKVLSCAVDGIEAGNTTFGHRFMAPDALKIDKADDYLSKLEQAYVIADKVKREAVTLEKAKGLATAEDLVLVDDAGLLAEVAGLVEWPVPLMGRIDDAFMDVPEEVLVSVMRTHQKYLALRNKSGQLAPRFITIANIETADNGAKIIAGNERVLRARLSDARFFWDEDRKTDLSARKPDLDKVTFHAKLGTVSDKTDRIEKLVAYLADIETGFSFEDLSQNASSEVTNQAAALCKADLVTGMVYEFPELQGIMGGYYATLQLGNDKVGNAIRDHYKPLGPNDAIPATSEGRMVAMADKMDTLAGFWLIDELPTGSKDPYALRRASLGIIRMLIEGGRRLNLDGFINAAMQNYPASLENSSAAEKLRLFFIERLKIYLRDKKDIRPDIVDSVLAVSVQAYRDDIYVLSLMAEALKKFLASE
ncbi:MAG: glycine--tRNA ligase subunit beta, partial [Candidatus Micropelagos thuwalensis]|nr:glycine--tRNA ligase subunit beta [Candidatus Micropelagos thuwalensis]